MKKKKVFYGENTPIILLGWRIDAGAWFYGDEVPSKKLTPRFFNTCSGRKFSSSTAYNMTELGRSQ